MKYTITIGNQVIGLRSTVFSLIVLIGFLIYYRNNLSADLWRTFSLVYGISIIPVLYLHMEYYYFNWGTTLEIKPFENILIYSKKSNEIKTIYFNKISKIVYYMDPTWHRRSNFRILPFARYHYAKIYLESGDQLIITSLMIPRIEDAFKAIVGVPVEKHIRLYSSILIESLFE